jgi:CheY-like chemotaxis protein
MSHELRTPLNGILGYAQILQRSKTIVEKDKKGIDVIHQCGSHLLTLINDVLDLSKIEARKLELQVNTFHFPSFLQSVVEICRIKAEQKGIEFYYQPDPNLPEGIKADEKRLRQVLLNLMGNAIKFTEQGHVAFSVKLQSQPASSPMLKVRFQIDDTGVGMLPEQLEKIFLPFEQVGETKKQTEGTGLGLSISQRIVALMGGEIQVTSQPGAGSTFWFEAEVQLAETWMEQSRKRQQGLVKGYEGKKCRILIVDDRWENRSVLVQLLEPIGFELIEASHGKEGLEQAIAHQPDLIMTDLAMPVMDGWALVQQLRQSPAWSGIIIASSASVFEMDRQRALAAGCDDFLPKPVEANELLKQLQSHLLLEWVYEAVEAETPVDSATNQSLTIPPAAELTALLKAVEHCRVVAIQAEAQRLKQLDAQYKAFADRVLALTDEFELEAIAQLITTNLP